MSCLLQLTPDKHAERSCQVLACTREKHHITAHVAIHEKCAEELLPIYHSIAVSMRTRAISVQLTHVATMCSTCSSYIPPRDIGADELRVRISIHVLVDHSRQTCAEELLVHLLHIPPDISVVCTRIIDHVFIPGKFC